jgi:AraC-like DNA-binding protein
MDGMVQAQSLRGYRELVKDLGGGAARLLRKAGIEPAALNQLSAFVSFENLIDLLETSASDLDCPDFGLRLAERQDIGILGTLAVAMRHSGTVGEAMRCASKYLHVYNGAIAFTVDIEERSGQARLLFGVLIEHAPGWAQTAEHGIGLAWRIMTLLSGGQCRLEHIWLPHAPVAAEATYSARFDAPLTFRADRLALAYSAKDLERPIDQANQELHDIATRYLDAQLPPAQAAFSAQVRRATEALIGTGTCGHRQVASTLHMHPRTMQRRLNEEGSTFEEIKDETRRDLAERYLSHHDLPLTQVTALLDYTDQSAFGRSCRRWFNATPREVRTRLSPSGSVPA